MTLKERINRHKEGAILFSDSFVDYSEGTARNIMLQLVREGVLVRISKGVYYKPIHTRLGILYPSVEDIIKAIAKRDHADILPTGNTAMHQLGLTTQIPMNYEFLTNGAARKVQMGNRTIVLRHGVANNFAFKGKFMPILHQAMKAIGKDAITDNNKAQINQLKAQINQLICTNFEKNSMRYDLKLLPAWERKIVQPIIENLYEQVD